MRGAQVSGNDNIKNQIVRQSVVTVEVYQGFERVLLCDKIMLPISSVTLSHTH